MAQVKFVTTAKYKGVRYPAHTPFDVDDKDVDCLVNKGAIVICGPNQNGTKSLEDMKVDELRAFAKDNDIDLRGVERKDDILNRIKEALESE